MKRDHLAVQQHRDERHRCTYVTHTWDGIRVVQEMLRICSPFDANAADHKRQMKRLIRLMARKGACAPSRTFVPGTPVEIGPPLLGEAGPIL